MPCELVYRPVCPHSLCAPFFAQSRAVGFFKLVQSAGWCVGFALSPTNRLAPLLQLAATALCYVAGLAALKLPPKPGQVPMVPAQGGAEAKASLHIAEQGPLSRDEA